MKIVGQPEVPKERPQALGSIVAGTVFTGSLRTLGGLRFGTFMKLTTAGAVDLATGFHFGANYEVENYVPRPNATLVLEPQSGLCCPECER